MRTSLEGQALTAGKFFALDASTQWQFCYGGAAAGSNEKFLFHTNNGGASWTLISRTTLGSPPAEAGVGELPNGNGVSALFFQECQQRLARPEQPRRQLLALHRRRPQLDVRRGQRTRAGRASDSISFTDAMNGSFVTPDGTWTTSNGGSTWAKVARVAARFGLKVVRSWRLVERHGACDHPPEHVRSRSWSRQDA